MPSMDIEFEAVPNFVTELLSWIVPEKQCLELWKTPSGRDSTAKGTRSMGLTSHEAIEATKRIARMNQEPRHTSQKICLGLQMREKR
jgi:hypothetical protein